MDRKLSFKEYILLASMLFGLFFGAGNLIFPASMGQQAGANLWPAIAGFCLTGWSPCSYTHLDVYKRQIPCGRPGT